MKHRDKLKLARRMMSRAEIKANVSPFLSKAWEARKKAIENRVVKKEYID